MLNEAEYRQGRTVLDHGAAHDAAMEYLTATGHATGARVDAQDDLVTVDVQFQQPLNILGVIGVGSITARGHGSARTAHGITQENG